MFDKPLFFIGCSPSQAASIINPDYPAAGAMISLNQLRDRKSLFQVGDWILDSGAFTEVARHGRYTTSVEQHLNQILKWSKCGNLLIAVAQNWMCEPFVLERTGLPVADHQRLTIERYEALIALAPSVAIMPVLQGYRSSDYLAHLAQYGDRLSLGNWVGVGSVCRRNGNPDEIANLLRTIKLVRPDLKLHGFGLKILALENPEVRSLLFSCDSMAWSFPLRFRRQPRDFVQNPPPVLMAHEYQQRIHAAVGDIVQKRIPRTAGAGNGQGRKSKWNNPTTAIRVPAKYAPKLLEIAREWDSI